MLWHFVSNYVSIYSNFVIYIVHAWLEMNWIKILNMYSIG